MQSGSREAKWLVGPASSSTGKFIEPLMGWTGSTNMMSEITLKFNSKEEAINFAKAQNYLFQVVEPKVRKIIKKNYADNFK